MDKVQNGTDDCKLYIVEKHHLRILLNICNEILKVKDDNFSKKYLPTQTGFFFGNCEYNEYYYRDIENTKNLLIDILLNPAYKTIYYNSSW